VSDEFHPTNRGVTPTPDVEATSPPTLEGSVCRIELIDYHAVDVARGMALSLHLHVASTSRASTLRDLADIDSARGICNHAISNLAHERGALWLARWQPLALDADTKAGQS